MRAELTGLALTVPALIMLLPVGGGVAAAYISLAAYAARLGLLLRSAKKIFGGSAWQFLVPTRTDLGWAFERARSLRAPAVRA